MENANLDLFVLFFFSSPSLPIPTREEIINSPIVEDGATSSFTFGPDAQQAQEANFVMDEPSADLERELEQTHLQNAASNVGK